MVIFTTQIFGTGKQILPVFEKTKQSPETIVFQGFTII